MFEDLLGAYGQGLGAYGQGAYEQQIQNQALNPYAHAQQAALQAQLQNYPPPYRRSRQEWLELSMDDLWIEWLSSGDQTFDEWYVAHIPAAD